MASSQVLRVALCRYVLQLPPLVEMNADAMVELLAPVLQHYLLGDLDGPVGVTAPPRTSGRAGTESGAGPPRCR